MTNKIRNQHKWEELFIDEFYEEINRHPIAYFASGPLEDHGAHNTLAVDMDPMYQVCLKAAEKLGGIVLPQIPFGQAGAPPLTREQLKSGKHELFPPSLFFSRELCQQIYEELFDGMARLGFKTCVALGGHSSEMLALDAIRQKNGGTIGEMNLITPNWLELVRKSECFKKYFQKWPRVMCHAGIIETSLMIYLRPELVDLSKVMDVIDAPYKSQAKIYLYDRKEPNPEQDHFKDLRENASADFGREVFDFLVGNIIAIISKEINCS